MERSLVDRFVRERDELLFRALYRAHTPALYLFALRILGGRPQDAEEAVQEAWIRAVSRLADFRWESSLRTWLCGIAWNCCRELMRRPDWHSADSPESVERQSAMLPAASSEIEDCIRLLPNGCREVLILHDIEGYTHREIAVAMGISEGTSKSQLSRARSLLRQSLKPSRRIHESR